MTRFFGLFGKWWMVGVTDHAWHTALLPLAVPLHKCKRQNVHKLMFTQRCARKCKMLRGKMAQLGIFTNNLFKTCQLKRLKRVWVPQAAEWKTYFTEVLLPYYGLATTWWLECTKGQLISKSNFLVLIWTKTERYYFLTSALRI